MGKGTPDHYDYVLNTKIKSLVSGAIKRARLEKAEPTISYERFVEDLDVGDSFTSTIIDCLVKELADRRNRPNASDRRLIAERTSRNLRALSSPFRVYGRSRRPSARRNDYISSPHDVDVDEAEEVYNLDPVENLTEGDTGLSEGPRSELYESNLLGYTLPRQGSPIPVTSSDETVSVPTFGSSSAGSWPPRSSTTLHIGALSRHPITSIRRPPRSRTVDFNDFTSFTSRRRNSSRLEAEASSSHDTSSRENIYVRPTTRRFFPASRRHFDREGDFTVWHDESDFEGSTFMASQWLVAESPPHDSASNDAETSDERTALAPRLRRGSIRAPETMLSRHASPVIVRGMLSPAPGWVVPSSAPASAGGSPRLPEPVAYPTPNSADDNET